MTISELEKFRDVVVVLHLNDGDVVTGRINFVGREYEDIIVDVLQTTDPERYKEHNAAVYAIKIGDVASVARVDK